MWHVALDCGDSDVVKLAMKLLLSVYVLGDRGGLAASQDQSPNATQTFIR